MTDFRRNYIYIIYSAAIAIIIILVFGISCSSIYNSESPRWNLAAIYNPASSRFHPSYRVYHDSNDRSLLLVKLFPSEMLFNQANPSGEFKSQFTVQIQNYEITGEKPVLVDSITYNYSVKQENVGRRFLAQIPFKCEQGKRYQLKVVARDLLRKDFNLRFIDVDKTSDFTAQNYNILNAQGIPYFTNIFESETIYKIEHRNKTFNKLYIDYYDDPIPLPNPTFASGSNELVYNKPDTTYILDYNPDMLLSFREVGMYFFRFDTSKKEGLAIMNFGNEFPKINSPQELVYPLTYLMTTADYKQILEAENKKLAVDNFWINTAGSTGRARELIRIYYNRVFFANYFFTTNKPGWKTDKGMIYIVYGPPQNMQKSSGSETWIYYMRGASSTINFTFLYKPDIYSIDNFVLSRSESQEWHWREAVESWRKGMIFLQD
jgi:GWxTD domain-containing protein